MAGFTLGIIGFLAALAAYATVVRRRESLTASSQPGLLLLGVAPLTVVVLAAVLSPADVFDTIIFACAIALSLCIAFLVANTAIESESPTQSLMLYLHNHRGTGVTPEMIADFIRLRSFRDSRLEGLIKDGAVERRGDRLVCRPGGRAVIRASDLYRSLIRRPPADG